jgi:hypothetical protein
MLTTGRDAGLIWRGLQDHFLRTWWSGSGNQELLGTPGPEIGECEQRWETRVRQPDFVDTVR